MAACVHTGCLAAGSTGMLSRLICSDVQPSASSAPAHTPRAWCCTQSTRTPMPLPSTGADAGWVHQMSPDGAPTSATLDCRKQLASLFASDSWIEATARAAVRACGTSAWGEYEMRAAVASGKLLGKSDAMFKPASTGSMPIDWPASGAGDYEVWWGNLRAAPTEVAAFDQIDVVFGQIKAQITPGQITATLSELPSAVKRIEAAAALKKAADARRVDLSRSKDALDAAALRMYYLVRSAAEAVDASIGRATMPAARGERGSRAARLPDTSTPCLLPSF